MFSWWCDILLSSLLSTSFPPPLYVVRRVHRHGTAWICLLLYTEGILIFFSPIYKIKFLFVYSFRYYRLQFVRYGCGVFRTQQHRDSVGHRLWTLHRHHVQQLPSGRRQMAYNTTTSSKGCRIDFIYYKERRMTLNSNTFCFVEFDRLVLASGCIAPL